MTKFSTKLSDELRKYLFTRNDRLFLNGGGPVTYEIKPGFDALAKETWVVHGVCLKCQRRSIIGSRCPECGIHYNTEGLIGRQFITDVMAQCEKAFKVLHQGQTSIRCSYSK